jgi:hypothetical protein
MTKDFALRQTFGCFKAESESRLYQLINCRSRSASARFINFPSSVSFPLRLDPNDEQTQEKLNSLLRWDGGGGEEKPFRSILSASLGSSLSGIASVDYLLST